MRYAVKTTRSQVSKGNFQPSAHLDVVAAYAGDILRRRSLLFSEGSLYQIVDGFYLRITIDRIFFSCVFFFLLLQLFTAQFSVKLMNISVESFSWLFDGNCCRRCSLPGSARLLLSGSKERLVLEAAGPGATGALWDPGRERGNRRSLGPSDTTRVLTFLHTLD